MKLEGSCHCGAVTFSFVSHSPYPYSRCYCSICRKVNGGGGYTTNIMGDYDTLELTGEEAISRYRAKDNHRGVYADDGLNPGHRAFCSKCGTMLWNYNPNYGSRFYPFASAIDTALPTPPAYSHIMLRYKAEWVEVPAGSEHKHYDDYPADSIESWHKDRGLWEE